MIHSNDLTPEHHAMVFALSQHHEPRNYEKASKDPDWIQAMNK